MNALRCRLLCVLLFAVPALVHAAGKPRINIWDGVPSMASRRVCMELYVPDRPNGTAVIICPGGSYHHLGLGAEGKRSAEWFSSRGVVACLLHYRVSQQGWHYPAPMQDVQRAIQLVREMAEGLGVDERRVGLIGYSAGGHLVTWAGAFAGRSDELAKLGLDPGRSIRPDFVIAVYPVVSMQDDIGHAWSRKSLLGKAAPPQELKDLFSLEMQIPKDMPPVYIVACRDDPVVDFENSERLYGALQAQGVPCEFAQYDWGGHGFGMKDGKFMRAFHWNEALARWLEGLAFLPE